MNIRVLSFVGMVAVSPVQAQTPTPLPETLAGHYVSISREGSSVEVIAVKLSEILTIGEYAKGVVSDFRSPAGYCVSDNTNFNGTYKNGVLSIKSAPMKSKYDDGRPCPGVTIEVKLDGGRATGTLKLGNLIPQRLELETK